MVEGITLTPGSSARNSLIREPCMQAKQHEVYCHHPQTRMSAPLQLVHSDLAGPFQQSPGGSHYFILYIDNFSRHVWIYFLKTKSSGEIIPEFKRFKTVVESDTRKIQRFRCDNETGEYNNLQFCQFLEAAKIRFEPSAPYTPHQNGGK